MMMDSASTLPVATLSVVSHGHMPLVRALFSDLCGLETARRCKIVLTLNLAGEVFDPSEFPGLHVIVTQNERPQGFGRNHNAAFRHCDSEWFFVLNPDLRLQDDVFAQLMDAGKSPAQDVGLVAPAVVNPAGALEDSVREHLSIGALLARRRRRPTKMEAPPLLRKSFGGRFYWFAGMFLCLRASAYRAVGGFDERFHLYCEDYDLSARLYLAGYDLVHVPVVSVIHDARRDSHRSFRHLRWHLTSLMKVWLSAPFWRIWWRQLRAG